MAAPKAICGVYFLFVGDKLVYVGQSLDIHGRIADHRRRRRDFDAYSFVEFTDKEKLGDLERVYIHKFRPEGNLSAASFSRNQRYSDDRVLTDEIASSLRPAEQEYWVWCGAMPGFGVRVQLSGRKTFGVRYRTPGRKHKMLRIARVGDMNVDEARRIAAAIVVAGTGIEPVSP